MLVFVYGTLKRGYWNHERFMAGAEFVGEASTHARYLMLGHSVPMLVRADQGDPNRRRIMGEVFDFDPRDGALERLDQLEGAYDRVRGKVIMASGAVRWASYYVGRKGHWYGGVKQDLTRWQKGEDHYHWHMPR